MEDATPALGERVTVGAGTVLVGTCSWTDKTLTSESDWYPRRTMSPEERLRFYAARFPLAEIDSTYYGPPRPAQAEQWASRTPDGFRFNVKAYSLLTGHPTRPRSLWPDLREALSPEQREKRGVYAADLPPDAVAEAWRRFGEALRPLHEAGRLGAVLLQYPPWFTPKKANRDELRALRARLPDYRLCVELRSPRWLAEPEDRERTLRLLEDEGLAVVGVDAPRASRLVPVLAVTRPDLAVVRCHGRAEDTWSDTSGSAAERFRYLYPEAELAELAGRVRELAHAARETHVLMNNCYRDYAVRNAARLRELLAGLA